MTVFHRHHKIPRHAGGTDDSANIELLTVEEHAEAHRRLFEKHGRWQDRIAWRSLSGQINFAEARLLANIEAQTGRPKSPEHRRKLSEGRKGKSLPENVRKAISDGHRGISHTEESKRKIGNANRGRVRPKEEIEKCVSARHDSQKITLFGKAFRSHSQAGEYAATVWGCSKDAARCRIRTMIGYVRPSHRKPHNDLFGPIN